MSVSRRGGRRAREPQQCHAALASVSVRVVRQVQAGAATHVEGFDIACGEVERFCAAGIFLQDVEYWATYNFRQFGCGSG